MPHIKVEPFNKDILSSNSDGFIEHIATLGSNSMVLVNYDGIRLFLDIINKKSEYLVKPNKITKISDSSIIKDILNKFAKEFNLKVTHSNTNVKPYKPKVAHWAQKGIEDFYNFSSEYSKVKVEVGFGSARHLLYRAKEEPDALFIGIEIHTPSISQLLKQINLQGIKNILVLNYDARLLLEMLPSNILDTIYVHFPVPWDKKPHRRVISEFFLRESLRTLKKGAYLELRTDSENYYSYALEVFSSTKVGSFSVKKNIDIEVISKYEERWRRMNKNIYTLVVDALEESKEKTLDIDFTFSSVDSSVDLPKESLVKDDFFVHFGKRYEMDRGFVVECSFGSFNIPEKKIIAVVDGKCSYLPSNPVKSLVNLKAHNLIKEVLNG
jgi:tRNA (guanine-N7-)-methyltransferase